MVLQDAGVDQGGFGAADGPSHQLTVLREAGCDVMVLQDAGIDQGGWRAAMANPPAGSTERKSLHDAGIGL